MSNPNDVLLAEPPTNKRFIVLLYLCSMSFVLYLDRICMGQALKPIRQEFGLENWQMSIVMAAFTLAYAIFEIPTGHMGDRWGARRVMTRIVLCWSFFTGLTAAARGFYSLIVVRFLFGAGEAGAYPNAARIVSRWFPEHERGRTQGWMLSVGGFGGMFAPPLTAYIIEYFGWRWTFQLFALVGVVWAIAFHRWFRDEPSEHPGVNAAELKLIGTGGRSAATHHLPIPWDAVFRNRCIWLLGVTVTCAAFNSYLYFSWYSTYLQEAREVSQIRAGWLSCLVLFMSAVGTILGGYAVDRLRKTARDFASARRRLGITCFFVSAVCLLISVPIHNPDVSAFFAALSCGVMMGQQAAWWTCAWQVSGKHIGSLSGLMNGMGGAGAILSQLFFGFFGDWRKGFDLSRRDQLEPAMFVYAAVLVCGAICWMLVDPSRSVDDESAATHP